VRYVRMFSGPDGESHFEDVETSSASSQGPIDPLATLPVSLMRFVSAEANYGRSWHNAPLRQYVVTLSGWWEIQVSDGEVRRFGPGSVLLAEDTTGKGHTNRVDGPTDRLMIHADNVGSSS
jgi:hypothetical protein